MGVAFGVLPDADALVAWWTRGAAAWGDRAAEHQAAITHAPIFYLAIAAALAMTGWVTRSRLVGLTGVVAAVGGLVHLALDCVTIGWGIMWFYPWSEERYGWNIVTRRHRAEWGDEWLRHYVTSRWILIEAAIISASVLVWRHEHRLSKLGKGDD